MSIYKVSRYKMLYRSTFEGCDSDHLVYHLEIVICCTKSIESIKHFYHNAYTILLLKSPRRTRYQDSNHDTDLNVTELFNLHELDHIELHYHKAAIVLELVAEVDKLRWYCRVNTDEFRKIIPRIDSRNADGSNIAAQIEDHLCKSAFATQAQCLKALENIYKVPTYTKRSRHEIPKNPSSIQQIFCTRIAKVDPSISVLEIFRAIESDNSLELGKLIDAVCERDLYFTLLQFLHVLFECSVQCFSKSSLVDVLISHAISLDAVLAIENCLRDFVIKLGHELSRRQQMTPSDYKLSLSL